MFVLFNSVFERFKKEQVLVENEKRFSGERVIGVILLLKTLTKRALMLTKSLIKKYKAIPD